VDVVVGSVERWHRDGVERLVVVEGEVAKLGHGEVVGVVLAIVLLDEAVVLAPHVPPVGQLRVDVGLVVGRHPVEELAPDRLMVVIFVCSG
jgi:hypothetical protein